MLTFYINVLYLMPMAVSLFYLLLQLISDINRKKAGKRTIFRDKEHINGCIKICFFPIINIYIAYISVEGMLKSLKVHGG